MATVNQPSLKPTNKLSAAMLAASIAGIIQAWVIDQIPTFANPVIWAPLPILIGGVIGWFVKDKPNVEAPPNVGNDPRYTGPGGQGHMGDPSTFAGGHRRLSEGPPGRGAE